MTMAQRGPSKTNTVSFFGGTPGVTRDLFASFALETVLLQEDFIPSETDVSRPSPSVPDAAATCMFFRLYGFLPGVSSQRTVRLPKKTDPGAEGREAYHTGVNSFVDSFNAHILRNLRDARLDQNDYDKLPINFPLSLLMPNMPAYQAFSRMARSGYPNNMIETFDFCAHCMSYSSGFYKHIDKKTGQRIPSGNTLQERSCVIPVISRDITNQGFLNAYFAPWVNHPIVRGPRVPEKVLETEMYRCLRGWNPTVYNLRPKGKGSDRIEASFITVYMTDGEIENETSWPELQCVCSYLGYTSYEELLEDYFVSKDQSEALMNPKTGYCYLEVGVVETGDVSKMFPIEGDATFDVEIAVSGKDIAPEKDFLGMLDTSNAKSELPDTGKFTIGDSTFFDRTVDDRVRRLRPDKNTLEGVYLLPAGVALEDLSGSTNGRKRFAFKFSDEGSKIYANAVGNIGESPEIGPVNDVGRLSAVATFQYLRMLFKGNKKEIDPTVATSLEEKIKLYGETSGGLQWHDPEFSVGAEQPDADLRAFRRCYASNLPVYLRVVTFENFQRPFTVPEFSGWFDSTPTDADVNKVEKRFSVSRDSKKMEWTINPVENVVFFHPLQTELQELTARSKRFLSESIAKFYEDDPMRHHAYSIYIPMVTVGGSNETWQPLTRVKEKRLGDATIEAALKEYDTLNIDALSSDTSFRDFIALEKLPGLTTTEDTDLKTFRTAARTLTKQINDNTLSLKWEKYFEKLKKEFGKDVEKAKKNFKELYNSELKPNFASLLQRYYETTYKEKFTEVFCVPIPKSVCAFQRHFFEPDLYRKLYYETEKKTKVYVPTILPAECFPVPKQSLGGHLCPASCESNVCLPVADEAALDHATFCERLDCSGVDFQRNDAECSYTYESPDHVPHTREIQKALIAPHQNPSVVWERLQAKFYRTFDPISHRIVSVKRMYCTPLADATPRKSLYGEKARNNYANKSQPLTPAVLLPSYDSANPSTGAMCYTTAMPVDRLFTTFTGNLDSATNNYQ